jgi:ABC-type uncharacterized transport system permease subunit
MLADSRIHLDALRAQFRASLAVQFQYRASQVIWLLFFVLQPAIYLSIWSAVAQSTGGQVGGYAPRDLAAYFLVSMWVIHLTFNGVLVFFEGRSGAANSHLCCCGRFTQSSPISPTTSRTRR